MASGYVATGVATVEEIYPVALLPPPDDRVNQLWGIPFIGVWVRGFLLIPHALVLAVLAIGMYVVMLVGWIPILLFGRVPDKQARWIEELIHRGTRTQAYLFLFPGGYPPLEPGRPGPVDVRFAVEGRSINRLWGIPIFGLLARVLALIPHIFVLWVLAACVGIVFLILWLPILLTGRFPAWAMTLYAGFLRYTARVQAYALLLPVPYPPFRIEN